MTLTSNIKVSIKANQVKSVDLGDASFPLAEVFEMALASGTGAGCADVLFTDTRTLSASATENLDLAAALSDVYGTTLTYAELRAIVITAATGNTNDVQVTRPASNGVPLFLAASDGIPVPPGGIFLWGCPADGKITVTASTGDLLTVTNSSSGTSVTYSVTIFGTSA